ncbi:MAG: PQQ-dependent sugar dehydrogenase, partial [Acidobacteriota bacterium]
MASGLDFPTTVVQPADGTGRFFVLEQPGRVRVVQDGELLPEPFLDFSNQVSCCDERGLIGLAFHPDFAANGELFVHYTDLAGDTQIVRYRVSGDPNRADPGSAEPLLSLGQPFANHNGGQLAFGPDGFLYIGLGDGGSGSDPMDNGQDVTTLLGKILRIDVDRTDPGLAYGLPPDNPQISDEPGARREIWAYGLRNPWRFSFDRATGDLFIGDVGENQREEIDLAPAGQGGQNFGWRLKEGTLCHVPSTGCEREGLVDPILEYSHDQGCSVTGGFRYRGSASPALTGVYLYGDFCSGLL